MKKIFITGCLGYIGIELINYFSSLKKFQLSGVDICYFADRSTFKRIPKNFKLFKKDYQNIKEKDLKGVDTVIHLASISNDPSVLLDPKLSWETNVLYTNNLLELCKKSKIKHFVFASSGSVYGVKKEKKVTENLSLVPISEYNKTKMVCENLVRSFDRFFRTTIIRPATVCGLSASMRLDVTVNILTFHALMMKKITVLGGKQVRPNIHIKDMIRLYEHVINKKITGTFNAGYENLSVMEIAKIVKKKISDCNIIQKKSNDKRSYRLDSSKIQKTGFKYKYSIIDAMEDLILAKQKKILKNKKNYSRVNFLLTKINKIH